MTVDTNEPKGHLVIDASRQGVLRFAPVSDVGHLAIDQIWQIEAGTLPTFTDALQKFERERGMSLRGIGCCIAVAGSAAGEVLTLVRSHWTIVRSGLEAVFGRPVIVINDVVARAWALTSGTASFEQLRGSGLPDFGRPGRFVVLNIEEGLGAALIDVDEDGAVRILGTEAGDMDFAPACHEEELLAKALKGIRSQASWEAMLMLKPDDQIWSGLEAMPESERATILGRLLGRFCVNLVHACGAWQGVLITGNRGNRILSEPVRKDFDLPFSNRRSFRRLLADCAAWRVSQSEPVLGGAAACLGRRRRSRA